MVSLDAVLWKDTSSKVLRESTFSSRLFTNSKDHLSCDLNAYHRPVAMLRSLQGVYLKMSTNTRFGPA